MRLNISGAIIPNHYKKAYDWFGMESTCPGDVRKILSEANGQPVDVYINSPGGYLTEGTEIYSLLAEYKGGGVNKVMGLAASAASIIAVSRWCVMSPVAQMMIHNVQGGGEGDYRDVHKAAAALDTACEAIAAAYVKKTGKSEEEVRRMMDDETWLTAQQALENGLVDEIMEPSLTASFSSAMLPQAVVEKTLEMLDIQKAEKLEQAKAHLEQLEKNNW